MKKTIAKRWVKALRSGKYKEEVTGMTDLRSRKSYSALGVLCDLSRKGRWGTRNKEVYYYLPKEDPRSSYMYPPYEVLEWAGMKDWNLSGRYEDRPYSTIWDLSYNWANLSEIASTIEKYYENL